MASAAIVWVAAASPAYAQSKTFDVPAQAAATGIAELGRQADIQIVAARRYTQNKKTNAVRGDMTPDRALAVLLGGTGLVAKRTGTQTYSVVPDSSASEAPETDASADRDDIIVVTAQKRRESIQDVPISMTALSQEDLTTRQVAGGPDLITQAPNITFSKTNFTGYTIQIRGIGTQAVSATTDPAVAIAFNNTPFIRNRFFEQEFYDVERIEILRGPQGTLYGRNATAGVVNLISAKPEYYPEAFASVDAGNYKNRRVEGMINIPLVDDKIAFRLAGAMTKRDGYTTNQMTGKQIDGRDLWSLRASLRLEPTSWLRADLVYEHFQEDDDRLRSGKQLCKKDPGLSEVGGVSVDQDLGGYFGARTYLSQGCLPVSLYSDEAFQTPNGFALPFYGPTGNLGNSVYQNVDPYASAFQSRDLRVIESSFEPEYRAKTDIFELQLNADLSDALTLTSETAYSTDKLFSTQDYNRFTTKAGAFDPDFQIVKPQRPGVLDANGVFCDPQLGCSDRLLLGDLSTAKSKQFSQELRLSSDFDGPFNFSLGANYLRYKTEDRYYVFINSLSMFAALQWGKYADGNVYIPGVSDNSECQIPAGASPDPGGQYEITNCIYIDPNPIGSLNGEGRNYFLSRNPYTLHSYAAFGEAYYNITPNLKLTGGLRFTVDEKDAPQIPSWLLAGFAAGEYPTAKVVSQKWSEPTGRIALDWQPDTGFTDHTLLYASFARGYKAGGANPPPPVLATYGAFNPAVIAEFQGAPETFKAEYVNAFEIGTKNTLFNGALTLNLGAFYYDYKDYQTSEIVNRAAVNSNFDSKIWGLEVEADWRSTDRLRLGFKGGYQNTRLANGSSAIDLMDRTAGNPDWVVVRPFPTIPSNCILPTYVVAAGGKINLPQGPGGSFNSLCVDAYYGGVDPITGLPYVANPTVQNSPSSPTGTVPLSSIYADYIGFDPASAPNDGKGFSKDLSGNELPNAPHYTATVTMDYTIPLATDWDLTLHGDYHYQSKSWARVINANPYDRLKGYSTVNVAAILNVADSWRIMAYVKNVFNKTALTGSFLNSDDSGLTTNVFLTEPRLYGLRVSKSFGEASLPWGSGWRQRGPGEPYPVELEFGMGLNELGYENAILAPDFLDSYLPSQPFAATAAATQKAGLGSSNLREARVTFNMPGGWHVSGAYRGGKFNARNEGLESEQAKGGYVENFIVTDPPRYVSGGENFGTIDVGQHEDHDIVDFMVGKDVGLGLMGEGGSSVLGFGVTYAQFGSATDIDVVGVPDRYRAEYEEIKYPTQHHSLYNSSLASKRKFEGFGPSLSWEASKRLAGNDKDGSLALDWRINGGLLFGKQTMASREERDATYYHFEPNIVYPPQLKDSLYDETIDRSRSQRVTVPNLGASLGLTYRIAGVKVAAGYRWERFFGAIDGGIDKAQSFDRTIRGAYVKFGIGF
jgi:outer membrane receptor protein involved in Fe transport